MGRPETSGPVRAESTLDLIRGSLVGIAGVHLATSSVWATVLASVVTVIIVARPPTAGR